LANKSDDRHTDDEPTKTDVSALAKPGQINPRSMLAPYAQIALHIRGTIITRQFPVGTVLPSEPVLAESYRVSRETVRRGLHLLRETGITETRRGVGTVVIRTPEVRRVEVAPGSQVAIRMPEPGEMPGGLGLAVIEVSEPGKPPAVYDTATTVLVFPSQLEA
jgi:DNA-binding transcriptional MocR family regulator